MSPKEIEEAIIRMFEDNYEALRLAGGHALTEDIKQLALKQVIAYYRKLKSVAEKITETEVKLTLPNQTTPKGNKFNIEGIVDIVREEDEVWMYDIKTHDADYIREHTEFYENQLNVYAHIWQNLRKNRLDHTAIISTSLPGKVKEAINLDNKNEENKELELVLKNWDPIIEINYKQENVDDTIHDFAEAVDNIEDRCFSAPPVKYLKNRIEGPNVQFATYVCRNCDARFSCSSYREYVKQSGARSQSDFWKYLEDTGDTITNEERFMANLEKDSDEE